MFYAALAYCAPVGDSRDRQLATRDCVRATSRASRVSSRSRQHQKTWEYHVQRVLLRVNIQYLQEQRINEPIYKYKLIHNPKYKIVQV